MRPGDKKAMLSKERRETTTKEKEKKNKQAPGKVAGKNHGVTKRGERSHEEFRNRGK